MTSDISLLFKNLVKDPQNIKSDHMSEEEKFLDFQSLIPMPDDLKKSWRALEEACEDPNKTEKEIDKLEEKIKSQNLRDYGYETPEQWAIENWGTEYNCYNYYIDKENNSLLFDTANTPPLPVVQELAKRTNQNLILFYCDPSSGIYGEMEALKTGEAIFRDYTEKTAPESFHNEFPKSFPPSKPSKPKNPNKGKDRSKNRGDLDID